MRAMRALPSRFLPVWTPDDFAGALASATGGNLRQAADLWTAIAQDDVARGVLSTRTLGLLGLPLAWEGPTPVDWFALAGEAELNALLSWGLGLGIGFAHIELDGSLRTWNARWFDYVHADDQWFVTTECGREPLGSDWIIFTPYGRQEPYFLGLWLALALPFLAKRYALHDRARASEVFGSAMIVGSAPEGADEGARKKWLADLEKLSRSSRVVLPDGYSLELIEAQGQTWGIYDRSVEWADNAITLAIAGQLVTTQGTSGFSRGDVHDRVARSLLRFTTETFSTFLGLAYVKRVWGYASFPRWNVDPPADAKAFADTLLALGNGIKAFNEAAAPRRIDVDELARQFAIPLTGPDPLTLPAPEPAVIPEGASREALAEAMTEKGIERCIHDRPNRCPICGIERDNSAVEVLPDGSAIWPVRWVPMAFSLRVMSASDPSDVPRTSVTASLDAPATEFRIFALGENPSDYGPVYLTDADAVISQAAGRDVMIDLEHLSLDSKVVNYDPDARGWARYENRNGELWAVDVRWTADGDARIREKRQRSISPVFYTDKGVITKITNLALTSLPAMHNAAVLVAANVLGLKGKGMDPKLLEFLGLAADATPDQVAAALAALIDAMRAGLSLPAEATAADVIAALAGEASEDPATEAPAPDASAPAPAQVAANTLVSALGRELTKLTARLDSDERARLMSTRAFTPGERKFLTGQPIESVRAYVANVQGAPAPRPAARGAEDTAAREAVRKAMGKAGK